MHFAFSSFLLFKIEQSKNNKQNKTQNRGLKKQNKAKQLSKQNKKQTKQDRLNVILTLLISLTVLNPNLLLLQRPNFTCSNVNNPTNENRRKKKTAVAKRGGTQSDQVCVSQKTRKFLGPENFSGLFLCEFLGSRKVFLKAPENTPYYIFSRIFRVVFSGL